MLDARVVRAAMRYVPGTHEGWLVEGFDAKGDVVATWTRITKPDGLLANINRHIERRKEVSKPSFGDVS